MVRYAYRAAEAAAIKEQFEQEGYRAEITIVSTRGNHGRAGYRSVRGTLVAQPSYRIEAHRD